MSTLRPVPEKCRPPVLRTWAEQKLKPLCSDALCGDLSSTLGSLPRQRSFPRHEGVGKKPPNRMWTRKWTGAALRPPKPLGGGTARADAPLLQGWFSLLGNPLSPWPLMGLPRAARLQWKDLEASADWGFPKPPFSRSRRPPGWVPGRARRFQPPRITWLRATWGQNPPLVSEQHVMLFPGGRKSSAFIWSPEELVGTLRGKDFMSLPSLGYGIRGNTDILS